EARARPRRPARDLCRADARAMARGRSQRLSFWQRGGATRGMGPTPGQVDAVVGPAWQEAGGMVVVRGSGGLGLRLWLRAIGVVRGRPAERDREGRARGALET